MRGHLDVVHKCIDDLHPVKLLCIPVLILHRKLDGLGICAGASRVGGQNKGILSTKEARATMHFPII